MFIEQCRTVQRQLTIDNHKLSYGRCLETYGSLLQPQVAVSRSVCDYHLPGPVTFARAMEAAAGADYAKDEAEAVLDAVQHKDEQDALQPHTLEPGVASEPSLASAEAVTELSDRTALETEPLETLSARPDEQGISEAVTAKQLEEVVADLEEASVLPGQEQSGAADQDVQPNTAGASVTEASVTGHEQQTADELADSTAPAATSAEIQETVVPGLGVDGASDADMTVATATAQDAIPRSTEGVSGVQLFFARAPPGVTEDKLKEIFGTYGEVLKVQAFMDRRAGISKGCGFIDMATHDQAKAAIEALDDKYTVEGGYTSLAVKWPDPSLRPGGKRKAEEIAPAASIDTDNTQLFIARIPRTATDAQARELFEQYGTVQEVTLFKSHPTALHCKGCGMVSMSTHDEAAAALAGLDNKHRWDTMDSPMVAKWVDRELQKRRKEGTIGYPGSPHAQDPTYGVPPEPTETAPAGCDKDTFKLYVNNIPRGWETEDMRPLIETYGTVIEFVLVRDKVTKQPRGSGFLWYKQRSEAEAALAGLNNQVLDSEAGRPLSVMRARPRTMTPGPAVMHGGYASPRTHYGGHAAYHPPPYHPAAYQPYYASPYQPAPYQPMAYAPSPYQPAAYDPNQQYGAQQGSYASAPPQAGYQ